VAGERERERERERASERAREEGRGRGRDVQRGNSISGFFFPKQTCLQHTRTQAVHSKQETNYKRTIEKSIFSSYSSFERVRDAAEVKRTRRRCKRVEGGEKEIGEIS